MSLLKECLNGQSKKHRIINCISFGTIGMAFVLLITIFYWLLYPYKPLVINQRPLPVLEKTIKKGDLLRYTFDYCKYTDESPRINKKFSDGIEFALPEYSVSNPSGCRVQTITTQVPHTLPDGEYILVATYTYKVNPIRDVIIKTHTEKFTVTE